MHQDSVYISCNNLYLMIVVLKVGVLYAHKMEFFDLVTFTRTNFWRSYRDPEEKLILAECRRICTIFVVVISFCAQGTCTGYMITPIIGISKFQLLRENHNVYIFFSEYWQERVWQGIAVQLVGRFPRGIVALLRDPFHRAGENSWFLLFLKFLPIKTILLVIVRRFSFYHSCRYFACTTSACVTSASTIYCASWISTWPANFASCNTGWEISTWQAILSLAARTFATRNWGAAWFIIKRWPSIANNWKTYSR